MIYAPGRHMNQEKTGMKPKIRTPFFETSVKNYIYGDDVYNFAKAADNAAKKI